MPACFKLFFIISTGKKLTVDIQPAGSRAFDDKWSRLQKMSYKI